MSIFDIFRKERRLNPIWDKYYTKEELDIEIPNISMYDQIRLSTHKYGNNTAIMYMGKKIKYKKLFKKINLIAKGFNRLGIGKGDIVTILLPNIPEVLYSLYAINKLGAIANMTHPLAAEEEIKDTLISTKSKTLIIFEEQYEKIKNIINETDVTKVIFVSPADSLSFIPRLFYKLSRLNKFKHHPVRKKYMTWKELEVYSHASKKDVYHRYGKDTPAVILHSGGTSGKPKNVVIQNRAFNFAAKAEKIKLKELQPGDSCLAIMPNFHGFGLSVCMHTPLSLGCFTTLVPKFDAKKFDILFNKTKPTCVLGVPTLYEALINCDNIPNLDLSNLKYVISGGDLLPKSLENRINEYLASHDSPARVTQGYGLSEALAAVCLASDDLNKSGSIGIPLPGNHIKIIDDGTRKEKPIGEV